MAARKKRKAASPSAMIISKTRVKAAVKKCNVGAEFYPALEGEVRELIKRAEERAVGNRRKTLRAADV
jgi:histone H3/H4